MMNVRAGACIFNQNNKLFEVSLKVSIRVIYCFLSKASDNKSSSSVSKMLINIYWMDKIDKMPQKHEQK